MTIAHDVSFSNASSSSGTGTSLALSSATPTAGACIGGWFLGAHQPTITDTQLNSYTLVPLGSTGGSKNFSVWFYYTPTPSAVTHTANVISANWSGGSDAAMNGDSWNGVAASAPLDLNACSNGNSAGANVNTFTCPAGAGVLNSGSVLLGLGVSDGTAAVTWTQGQFNGVAQTGALGNEGPVPSWVAQYQLSAVGGTGYNFTTNWTGTAFPGYAGLAVLSPIAIAPPPAMLQGQSGFMSPW